MPAKRAVLIPLGAQASEAQIQRALVEYLDWAALPDCVWFSCPNGGYRLKTEAARFKGLGVKAGVPDMVFVRNGIAHGLELKTPTGRLTPAQINFLEAWRKAGGRAQVAFGLDEAINVLNAWGLVRPGRALFPV